MSDHEAGNQDRMKMKNLSHEMNQNKILIKGKWNWTNLNASYELLLHQMSKWNK